ncbi:MAG: lysine transporter LysE [Microbacteriaceae bacterium]|nr:lysine transporter LysE [Microbacteriaceae bacterium]
MIPAGTLLAFTLTAVGLMCIPGPSMLFVIGRSLALGRVGGLLSVAGNASGTFVNALAVALGVGVIVQQSLVVFTIVKVAGAAYLVYLGIQAIRHRNDHMLADAEAPVKRRSTLRLLGQAFLVGVSNPKTIVFLLAVLPQFVNYRAGNVTVQLMILGAIFVGTALVCDSIWAIVAGSARAWFAKSPKRIGQLGAVGGVMMIGLGGVLLVAGSGKD